MNIFEIEEQIVDDVMKLYGIQKPNESSIVTLRKIHNKFIFDKAWYSDLLKQEDQHYRQMALILNFGGRLSNLK